MPKSAVISASVRLKNQSILIHIAAEETRNRIAEDAVVEESKAESLEFDSIRLAIRERSSAVFVAGSS
jgi:hypothetical protein